MAGQVTPAAGEAIDLGVDLLLDLSPGLHQLVQAGQSLATGDSPCLLCLGRTWVVESAVGLAAAASDRLGCCGVCRARFPTSGTAPGRTDNTGRPAGRRLPNWGGLVSQIK